MSNVFDSGTIEEMQMLRDSQGNPLPLADAGGQLAIHVGDVVYKRILGQLVAFRVVALNPLVLG